ncbi:MAG: FAD-dependent oxidoreductase [Planctomycetota bacterium]
MSMMDETRKTVRVRVSDSYDVIVAGGGPAGCAAAVAAAREGARTLLLEDTGALGGMGTAGLVPWFAGYQDGEKIIARGLAEHVRCALRDQMPHLQQVMEERPLAAPAIDPELLKGIYDEMVVGAGAKVLFHSRVCAVEGSESGRQEAVIVANKSGLLAFRAKVFIDGTGDGDLAAWAGAEFEKGDANGAMQPATHCFMLGNIDEERLAEGPRLHWYDPDSPIWKIARSDEYPLIDHLHACSMKIAPHTFGFNTGHLYDVDNTDPDSVTRALLKGRQMARQYRDALAEHHPAFREAFLAATGSLMGIRETRRVLGDYVLTVEDYLARRSFPDEICRNAYGVDVHAPLSPEQRRQLLSMSIEELKERNRKITQPLQPGESFGVPYRSLVPRGLENVLVAGRCLSADRGANGSTRIMACCLNTGEAAGIAAAMAAVGTGDVRGVDTDRLRETLKNYGAYLPDVA